MNLKPTSIRMTRRPSLKMQASLNPRNAPEFTLGMGGTLSVPVGDGT